MANVAKVIQLTSSQYEDLINNGSITVNGVTYTYDPNVMYLVDEDEWETAAIDSTSGVSVTLKDNATYYFEAMRGTVYATVCFGLINMNMSAGSVSTSIVALSANFTSSTVTTNTLVRLQMYRTVSDTWNVRIYTGTSLSSLTADATYSIRFKKVNI